MSGVKTKKVWNLTEGPIAKQIVRFAIPLFISSMVMQLYNTVDLIFVGQLLDRDATAAVGASSMLITLMVGFFGGVGIGVGILTGKSFGSGDRSKVKAVIHNAAGLSLIGALILMVLGWLLSPIILRWMNTPQEIQELAVLYLRYYFICMVSVICFSTSSGILRALGNSRDPMIYQLIGGLANVFGDFIFMYVFHLGVRGVALATLFSQTCAAAVTIRHLFRLDPEYRLEVRQIRIEKNYVKEILGLGLPSGIQSMVITLSNIIIQSQVNKLGVVSIAAFTAYYRVENFIYSPILAFGSAASVFVSQNIGAKKLKRAKEGTRTTILTGVCVTIVISIMVILLYRVFFGLFTKDANVIELGGQMARVSYPFYFIYVFLEVFASSIRGAGKTFPPMLITVINMCCVRTVILMTIMSISPEARNLIAVYPLTWAVTSICLGLYYRSGKWVPADLQTNQL